MTDTDRMVVWLREAMDAAQRDAEAADAVDPSPWTVDISTTGSPERPRPGAPNASAGMIRDARGDDLWECEGTETLCMTSASAKHAARHDPAAVLRRIAADRKLLDLHTTAHTVVELSVEPVGELFCCECDGPCTHKGEAECEICGQDGCDTGRLLAEGWGWTEETT